MNDEMFELIRASLPTYRTGWDCLYITDGRKTEIELQFIDSLTSACFGFYLARGYRRYRDFFYRNVCENCRECVPLRIDVAKFRMSKSQRRTWKANGDVEIRVIRNPTVTDERLALFRKYRTCKHPDPEEHDFREMLNAIYGSFPGVFEVEFLLSGRVIGVSVLDEADDGFSANYFYYDTDFLSRRPGIFSMLVEIGLCRESGKRWYYPGFTIESLPKMAYKRQFRPNEALIGELWSPYTE